MRVPEGVHKCQLQRWCSAFLRGRQTLARLERGAPRSFISTRHTSDSLPFSARASSEQK